MKTIDGIHNIRFRRVAERQFTSQAWLKMHSRNRTRAYDFTGRFRPRYSDIHTLRCNMNSPLEAAVMRSFGDVCPFADPIKRSGALLICQVQSLALAKLEEAVFRKYRSHPRVALNTEKQSA